MIQKEPSSFKFLYSQSPFPGGHCDKAKGYSHLTYGSQDYPLLSMDWGPYFVVLTQKLITSLASTSFYLESVSIPSSVQVN